MPQRIEEIYKDKKYDKVVYYFKEKGITTAEDLETFDFNNLMFVPGLSNDLIYEAKKVFQNFDEEAEKNSWKLLEKKLFDDNSKENYIEAETIENVRGLSAKDKNISQQYFINESENIAEKNITEGIDCMPVEELFCNMPNGDILIEYCHKYEIRTIGMLRAFNLEIRGLFRIFLFMSKLQWYFKNINQSIENGIGEEKIFKYVHTDGLKHLSDESEGLIIGGIEDLSVEEMVGALPDSEVLISYCHKHDIKNLGELKKYVSEIHRFMKITLTSIEKMQKNLKSINRQFEDMKLYGPLNDVPQINRTLAVNVLKCVGVSEENVKKLNERGFHVINDLCNAKLVPGDYILIGDVIPFMNTSITDAFLKKFNDLKENQRKCLIQRSQGFKLQEIGEEMGVTRERVRQIVAKACRYLMRQTEMLADILLHNGNNYFAFSEIQHIFPEASMADCYKYILLESTKVQYLSFCDKFIGKTIGSNSVDLSFGQFSDDVIGYGINFYDNMDYIEAELPKYGLEFLDLEDIMNYLVKSGYRFYGDYVQKYSTSNEDIYHDAISKYFQFDIKLDGDENNKDMKLLRKIIGRNYRGIKLPENNRAFTAVIARGAGIILSGRGSYCPVEKAIFSNDLLEEVYQYMRENKQTSFYYAELFALYKGRFLSETNISNPHFLHGILKYFYPDNFLYRKDFMVKTGAIHQDISNRISELIIAKKGAITKDEIKKAFLGIKDFNIVFAVERAPKLINWEDGMYNHIDNISCNTKDLEMLGEIISGELNKHKGYLSEKLLFDAVKFAYPKFIDKNQIVHSSNLFYTIGHFFSERYRFKRPHILSYYFPISELNIANIAKALLGVETTLKYSSFVALARSLYWPDATQYAVFNELENEFFRISEDDYVKNDSLSFSKEFLQATKKQIAYYVGASSYYAISGIFSFDSFPDGIFKWNEFLLESIIEEFDVGFKIINPQVRDRRYLRGIIVPKDSKLSSFEDLVISIMEKDGVKSMSEIELQKYLKNKGLIFKLLPQEIYECPKLPFKNGQFTLTN